MTVQVIAQRNVKAKIEEVAPEVKITRQPKQGEQPAWWTFTIPGAVDAQQERQIWQIDGVFSVLPA